jgi:hypothetical protein
MWRSVVLVLLIGCAANKPRSSIGSAYMKPDGTIQLMLRAEGNGGLVGDAMMHYAPGDKDYDMILRHVGGLKRGEGKPVPPFPK